MGEDANVILPEDFYFGFFNEQTACGTMWTQGVAPAGRQAGSVCELIHDILTVYTTENVMDKFVHTIYVHFRSVNCALTYVFKQVLIPDISYRLSEKNVMDKFAHISYVG